MATISDVAIAIKSQHIVELIEKFPWVEGNADTILSNSDGNLYVLNNMKWNVALDIDIANLYDWLRSLDPKDILVIDACDNYPLDCHNDLGMWKDNPWELRKHATVSLEYEE